MMTSRMADRIVCLTTSGANSNGLTRRISFDSGPGSTRAWHLESFGEVLAGVLPDNSPWAAQLFGDSAEMLASADAWTHILPFGSYPPLGPRRHLVPLDESIAHCE